jgi:predicted RNase H-like nuclease (RuvC/YqgF family)
MKQDKVSVGTRISPELANKCKQDYGSVANAINAGLELLYETDVNKSVNDNITYVSTISELNTQIEEKEQTIKDLQINNENLIKVISDLKLREPDNKEIHQLQFRIQDLQENQLARITDLKEQINSLNEQLNKKDKLLEDLNQTLIAQASNIYNLTQNPKLLPENKVKKWWRFW